MNPGLFTWKTHHALPDAKPTLGIRFDPASLVRKVNQHVNRVISGWR